MLVHWSTQGLKFVYSLLDFINNIPGDWVWSFLFAACTNSGTCSKRMWACNWSTWKYIENISITFGVIDIPAEVRQSLSSEMSCKKFSSRDWPKVDSITLFKALIDLKVGATLSQAESPNSTWTLVSNWSTFLRKALHGKKLILKIVY